MTIKTPPFAARERRSRSSGVASRLLPVRLRPDPAGKIDNLVGDGGDDQLLRHVVRDVEVEGSRNRPH
jgi:hypothetical protein